MRRFCGLLAALIATFTIVGPAAAITGNFVPDTIHPYVGLVVFYDEEGEFSHRCSGTLIAPTIFLTAGHCTEGVASARVYFHQEAGANFDPETELDPTTGYPEFCIAGDPLCVDSVALYTLGDPVFSSFPNTEDIGIVVLQQDMSFLGFASLATAGSLDVLATQRGRQDITFTVSGYGVSRINPVQFESFRVRLMATTQLVNLNSALTGGFNLQTTANPGGGRGGTCFGDSGGPVFYDATTTIVGVTSFGLNPNCRGVDFAFRTDTAEVLAWIQMIAAQYGQAVTIVPIA
jgi:Trypsin